MGYFIDGRKIGFCKALFADLGTRLVFVDVGSGGPLKTPWTLLPPEHVEKVDFDPEALAGGEQKLPLCISDQNGVRSFHIAHDPRGSSLHRPNPQFMDWFGRPELGIERSIEVRCETLDRHFYGREAQVDFLDINVEGHDFHVLQGAERLFQAAFPKVVKIEFELAEVWVGQGWFADIDGWMRRKGFEMIDLSFDRIRPGNVRHVFHPGEPVWGKALYAPGASAWARRKVAIDSTVFSDDLRKAIGLYTILDAPGRAVALLQGHETVFGEARARQLREAVISTFKYGRVDFALDCALRVVRGLSRRIKIQST